MHRTVTTPTDLTGEALEDLKSWLGISRPKDDTTLVSLLEASLALCEAFTGQTPIEQTIEERIPPMAGHYSLATRPVRAALTAEMLDAFGVRTTIPADHFTVNIDADSRAFVSLAKDIEGQAVAVSLRAGIASDWASLPGALKQGIIRLAAFHYNDRESVKDAKPPASVTALWRPWRIVRLT